jgi:hypothetical protein
MEKKLVSFRIPQDLVQELKDKAQAERVTVTDLICHFSRQGLGEPSNGRSLNSGTATASPETTSKEYEVDLRERLTRLETLVDPDIKDRVAKLEGMLEVLLGGRLGHLQI